MVELTEEEFQAANERGRREMLTKPRALAVRYVPLTQQVTVELSNDCVFTFPARQVQGLEQATHEQLAAVEIMGVGFGLGWDELDTHITVEGLLAGRFGSRAFMERRWSDREQYDRAMRLPVQSDYSQAAE